MNTHARVVIVGGGVMGVSLLYHLTQRGWTDVVLLEKNELTAGSTWHAAGLCTHFAHNATIMEMRATSVRLYRDTLPQQTGESTGFHACGALRVTRSQDRMNEFSQVQGLGKFTGYDFNILSPQELSAIYPLCVIDGLVGAIYEPDDGHVDPTLATNAMASVARLQGAQIYRQCPVTGINRTSAGEWRVTTPDGHIMAEHIVNAAGTWCREIGTMMGVDLPVVPMLHQYLVTDEVPEIVERINNGGGELPLIRDPEESWYLRQERSGLIVGPYERHATPWAIDGVPTDFGMELLPPDLDKVEHIVAKAMARVPMLEHAGIKTIVNGPITFTPDANPLIGPAFGLTDAWVLTGSSMGVMEGGGAGAFLANWMIDGAPPSDALAIDSRRFGPYCDRDYRVAKAVECFGLQFGVHYPYEERPAGRPSRVTPLIESQRETGAVFGCAYGWERPNFFSTGNLEKEQQLTFGEPGWFHAVASECEAVTDAVGVSDLSAFSKFDVTGADAAAFIEQLGANRAPSRIGRVGLTHVLTPAGGVASEFAVTKLNNDHFYLTSAAVAERYDADLLRQRSQAFSDVTIVNRTEHLGVLALVGPQARHVLAAITTDDLSTAVLPWLSAATINVAGVSARVLRVSYVGELGYELHLDLDRLQTIYDAVLQAGRGYGLRPFGAYAMNSMRIEKGYRAFGMDLTTERTPLESGLGHLVRVQDREFIGRDAMVTRADGPDAWQMTLLELNATLSTPPFSNHTVFQQDRAVGIITSGAYGHRTQKHLALAYLTPGTTDEDLAVQITRHQVSAVKLARCPFDSHDLKLRQ